MVDGNGAGETAKGGKVVREEVEQLLGRGSEEAEPVMTAGVANRVGEGKEGEVGEALPEEGIRVERETKEGVIDNSRETLGQGKLE